MIVFFGGTFDPVHVGHTHAAVSVCEFLGLDRIRLVLSARPPHREKPIAPYIHRWEMLKLACERDLRLIPDDHELVRPNLSWTVETLQYYRDKNPEVPLVWVIGDDVLAGLQDWRDSDKLMELCNLAILGRDQMDQPFSNEVDGLLRKHQASYPIESLAGSIFFIQGDMLRVSATDIRACLEKDELRDGNLDPKVLEYIVDNNLYGVRS